MAMTKGHTGRRIDDSGGPDGHHGPRWPTWAIFGAVLSLALAVPYYAHIDGILDFSGHAVGRDFVNLWTGGVLIDQGQVLDIFDPQAFAAAQRALVGPDFPLHFWSYPPTALFLAAPLAGMPYLVAYAVWTGLTFAALVIAARALLRDWSAVLILAIAPSTVVNLMLGQNGYLTCALVVGGLALLPRRPLMAGLLFGLLTFKPHLGIMIPVVLLALGQWRCVFAAVVAALALAAASVAVFGWSSWQAFVDTTLPYQLAFMSDGTGPFTWMMPTLFMSGRLAGLPPDLAYALQLALGGAVAVAVFAVFRRGGDWRLLSAVALLAPIVASPQAFNYDMGLVSVAILLLADAVGKDSLGMLQRRAIDIAWCLPILVMALNAAGFPIAPVLLAALMAIILRRLWRAAPASREVLRAVAFGSVVPDR
jgi:hypothetical protein